MINLKECFETILDATKVQMDAIIKAKLQDEGGSIRFHHNLSFIDTSEDAMLEECEMRIQPQVIYLDEYGNVKIKYKYFSTDGDYSEEFDNVTDAFTINELDYIAELLEDE